MESAYYPPADRTVQDFEHAFVGSPIKPNVVVLHTTEGTSWDPYKNGAEAPHLTSRPMIAQRTLAWRQHFPLTMSARALVNSAGGVETNTLNCAQVELVGTCDPAHQDHWGSLVAGRDYIYWPEAPDWCIEQLAEFLAFMHTEWGLRLQAPSSWPAYPDSYGSAHGQRLTFRQWRNFYGVCGHMHVPENVHGDPGNIAIGTLLARATDLSRPRQIAPPATPVQAPVTRGKVVDHMIHDAQQIQGGKSRKRKAAQLLKDLLSFAPLRKKK